jgi:hypothetical protein
MAHLKELTFDNQLAKLLSIYQLVLVESKDFGTLCLPALGLVTVAVTWPGRYEQRGMQGKTLAWHKAVEDKGH